MLKTDDEAVTKQMIKEFLFERNYLMSCDYCNGRNGVKVRPSVQVEKALTYVKKGIGL